MSCGRPPRHRRYPPPTHSPPRTIVSHHGTRTLTDQHHTLSFLLFVHKKTKNKTVPVFHKRITFLIGPKVSEHFFKAKDTEMSQKEVYEFNVPTFGKGVVFDVDHQTRAEQFRRGSPRPRIRVHVHKRAHIVRKAFDSSSSCIIPLPRKRRCLIDDRREDHARACNSVKPPRQLTSE